MTSAARFRGGARTVPMLLPLDGDSDLPRFRQIYLALRDAILEGSLTTGSRLPASRVLADDLGVSRTTVLTAYAQLASDGFIMGRAGAGTRILAGVKPRAPHRRPKTSGGGEVPRPLYSLAIGVPALDAFPVKTWSRLMARRWRGIPRSLLLVDDGSGYAPLREAIAEYVLMTRAVRCTPEQVIITGGVADGINLAAKILLDSESDAWIEEPACRSARAAIQSAGARIVGVPVDAEGLDTAAGRRLSPGARVALVTPSHQVPLGCTMSLRRRLALLDWASQSGAWILENDHSGHFRYDRSAVPAIQGLDHPGAQRVIHLGAFDVALFPGLRIGYAIVPPALVDTFMAARRGAVWHPPIADQAVLADFITGGHFARHTRRMRSLYAERQGAFLRAAAYALGGALRIEPSPSGLHLVGWLPPDVCDRRVSHEASLRGVRVEPLSDFRAQTSPSDAHALLFGYAALRPEEMRSALTRIAEALRAVRALQAVGA